MTKLNKNVFKNVKKDAQAYRNNADKRAKGLEQFAKLPKAQQQQVISFLPKKMQELARETLLNK